MINQPTLRSPARWLAAVALAVCASSASAVPFILTPNVNSVAPGGGFSLMLAYQSTDALELGMDFSVDASNPHVTLRGISSLAAGIANPSIVTNPVLPGVVPNTVSLAIDASIGGDSVAHDLLQFNFLLDSTAPAGFLDILLNGLAFVAIDDPLADIIVAGFSESARLEVNALSPGGQVPEGNVLIALLIGLVALYGARCATRA